MSNLKSIVESLKWGAEVEGKEYDYKALTQEDVHWLVNEVRKYEGSSFYMNEGVAIFAKGSLVVGIHPDNLENNLKHLKEGTFIDWKTVAENMGIKID